MRVTVESSSLLGPPSGMKIYNLELLRHLCAQNPEDAYRLYATRAVYAELA